MGDWTELIAETPADALALWILAANFYTASNVRSLAIDFALGAEGEEAALFETFFWGGGAQFTATVFPSPFRPLLGVSIPAGSRLSCRTQSNAASVTADIVVQLDTSLQFPQLLTTPTTYGVDLSNTRGSPVTPAVDAWGTWTQISDTPAIEHFLWSLAIDAYTNASLQGTTTIAQLGTGPDVDHVTPLDTAFLYWHGTAENIVQPTPSLFAWQPGTSNPLWCRLCAFQAASAVGVSLIGF